MLELLGQVVDETVVEVFSRGLDFEGTVVGDREGDIEVPPPD